MTPWDEQKMQHDLLLPFVREAMRLQHDLHHDPSFVSI